MREMGLALLVLFGATLATAVLGLITRFIDRKVTARVQWRVGPPWYQTFADILKLLGKETLVPGLAKGTLFLASPVLGFAATSVGATMLWSHALGLGFAFFGDIIVLVYVLTIPSLMLVLGPASSGSPYGAVGASREMKLLLGYELPFVLALAVALIHTGGSLRIEDIVAGQARHGAVIGSVSGVVAALVSLVCIQAKMGLVPFDMAEAETELMGGILVEYSGPPLAVILLTRAMLYAALPMLLVTVFLGGIDLRGLGIVWALLKYLAIVVLMVLMRNTNPRLRIDQAVRFFWGVLAPIALAAVALAAYGRARGIPWL
ncbi:NADH-quinone oxidoreductase subunit H [Candidatus Fermentibacteria bacterium]|nr:NADH-quinone oxidoreductase subunit H [Candidatus Fermentibacteria bacterium]